MAFKVLRNIIKHKYLGHRAVFVRLFFCQYRAVYGKLRNSVPYRRRAAPCRDFSYPYEICSNRKVMNSEDMQCNRSLDTQLLKNWIIGLGFPPAVRIDHYTVGRQMNNGQYLKSYQKKSLTIKNFKRISKPIDPSKNNLGCETNAKHKEIAHYWHTYFFSMESVAFLLYSLVSHKFNNILRRVHRLTSRSIHCHRKRMVLRTKRNP